MGIPTSLSFITGCNAVALRAVTQALAGIGRTGFASTFLVNNLAPAAIALPVGVVMHQTDLVLLTGAWL
jgi:hypothetical protein